MKPKLLIIHNRLVIGGPALDTIPLAYHLRNDFEIHILYGCKEKDEVEPSFLLDKYKGLVLQNITSLQRAPHPFRDLKAYSSIYQYIKEFKPDIVHTHGAKVGLFGRLAAWRNKTSLIIHTFHGHLFHSYFNKAFTSLLVFMERNLLKITNLVIVISKSQEKDIQRILKISDESKMKLVPLGVDYFDHLMKDHYRNAFKRKYGIEANTICIGILGRMVGIKNPLFFIRVAEHILKTYPQKDIRFFVVGDGSETAGMKQYLREKKIQYTDGVDRSPVIFTSWIHNVQSIIEGLDMVVLTSFNEGTPLSLIEAQMCGKPVVAVNVGGVKDTMISNETGFLVEGHNVYEFSSAVMQLVNDENLREEMGKKARIFAQDQFSKEKEIQNMKAIYTSCKSA